MYSVKFHPNGKSYLSSYEVVRLAIRINVNLLKVMILNEKEPMSEVK